MEKDHADSIDLYDQWDDNYSKCRGETQNRDRTPPEKFIDHETGQQKVRPNVIESGRREVPDGDRLPSSTESHNCTISPVKLEEIRLPPVELVQFNGEPQQWSHFWQNFCSLVDNNVKLGNFGKHQYLRRSLEGEAAKLVEGLPVTGETYESVKEMLKESFGQVKYIIESLFQRLMAIRPLKSSTEIMKFCTNIQCIVRSIRSVSIQDKEHEIFSVIMIQQKMTASMREKWLKVTLHDQRPKLDVLLTFLQDEYLLHKNDQPGDIRDNHRTAFVNHITTKESEEHLARKISPICSICQMNHPIWKCELSISEKRNRVKINNLCFNCLRPGHRSKECRNQARCHECKGRHHTILCFTKREEPKNVDNNLWSQCNSTNWSRTKILPSLQIGTKEGIVINAQLDCSSTDTFVRKEILKNIQAVKLSQQDLEVQHFGGKEINLSKAHNVALELITENGEVFSIEAIAVEKIGETRSLNPLRKEEAISGKCSRKQSSPVSCRLTDVKENLKRCFNQIETPKNISNKEGQASFENQLKLKVASERYENKPWLHSFSQISEEILHRKGV
ncbi:hypothetical protein SNEBB_008161 [Seison nebaliae]|nr:hypothetical protein SNEBB_008161 [Seison nebaliae]